MDNRAVKRLAALLKVERKALLEGDFEALGSLIHEKEELAGHFDEATASELVDVSSQLFENERLLIAAKDGVSTVLHTLQHQRAARTSLSTYDRSGKAAEITQATRGTERRY